MKTVDPDETPTGTECMSNLEPRYVKTGVTSVLLEIKELDIPFDVIIGRPAIAMHKLLQVAQELCETDRGSKPHFESPVPMLTSGTLPVEPATEGGEGTV